jgi:hypothetical protein
VSSFARFLFSGVRPDDANDNEIGIFATTANKRD